MKNKAIRLGAAGALTALLAGLAVPAQAAATDPCGPVVDSVKYCTTTNGSSYPVLVNSAVAGPRPTIGGALLVGNTLTVIDGAWNPSDAALTHQWLRNDVPILGATGRTYRLTTADLGKGIRVKTTGTAPGYAATTVQSIKTTAVTNTGGAVPTVKAPAAVGIGDRDTDTDAPNPIKDAQPGIWSGAPGIVFHYQWLRDGAPIPGANAASFDTTGWGPKALLSVRITGYAAGYDPVSATSASRPFSSWNPWPGAVVTGGTGLGDVLTGVDNVPWRDPTGRDNTVYEHRYQWLRDGVAIPDATGLTYTITAADQGHTLVLYTDTDRAKAYSNAVAVPAAVGVELKQLTNVTKPVLTGTAVTGSVMKVTAGTWSEPSDKLTVSYDWLSPDGKVAASGPTFTPDQSDVGATVSVLVTVSAPGYAPTRVRVTASKPVTLRDPAQTRPPYIRGTPAVRMKLTVVPGAWARNELNVVRESYLWLRDGVAIAGATGRDYTPVGADFGKRISIWVTSTLDGRTLKTQGAFTSAKVAAGTLSSATPTIAGTVKAGNVVTVKRGTWTWGTVFTYRWLRNGVPISGATASTYKVRTADRDTRITVRVTGSRLGYTTVSQASGAYFAR